MTSFKKYFCYHFKSTLLRSTIVGAFFVLITLTLSLSSDYSSELITLIFCLFNMCIIVPILELSEFKIKRNMDTLLSMPIGRKRLATVHYINGLLQIAVSYLLCAIITLIRYVSAHDQFHFGYFVLFFVHSLFIGIIFYSFVVFAFNIGNSIIDGILIMALWFASAALLFWSLDLINLLNILEYIFGFNINFGIDFFNFTWVAPFEELDTIYRNCIEMQTYQTGNHANWCNALYLGPIHCNCDFSLGTAYYTPYDCFDFKYLLKIIKLTAFASLMVFGYIKMFEKQRVEKIGGISDSVFGYKLLVPLYGFSLISIIATLPALFIAPTMAIALGYIIYRRSFKLKKWDLIIIGIGIILLIIFIICDQCDVFRNIIVDIGFKKCQS